MKMTCRVMAYKNGLMEEVTSVNGTKVAWRVRVSLLLLMEGVTKVNILITLNKATAFSNGPMVKATKGIGLMGNNMAKVL